MQLRTHAHAFLILASVTASAPAGPPVQFRERVPETVSILGYDLLPVENVILTDVGDHAIIETETGGRGIARRSGMTWEVIREPVTLEEAEQPGVWYPQSLRVDSSGRVVMIAYGGVGAQERSIRSLSHDGTGWSEQELRVVSAGSTLRSVFVNNAAGVAWVERLPNEFSGRVLYHDGDSVSEAADLESLGQFYVNGVGLSGLFDDGGLVLNFNDYFDADIYFMSPGGVLTYQMSYAIDYVDGNYLIANPEGEVLRNNYGTIRWTPVGPSRVPAFTFKLSETAFAFTWQARVGSDGSVLYEARMDDGTMGLFIGPDPIADRVLTSDGTIFGRPVGNIYPTRITSRREFEFRIWDGGAYTNYFATICPADVNRDALFDNGDIAAFVQTYLAGSLRADFTNDGLLDNADIGEFVSQYLNAVSAGCG